MTRHHKEIARLLTICRLAHERLTNGEPDRIILATLERAWKEKLT